MAFCWFSLPTILVMADLAVMRSRKILTMTELLSSTHGEPLPM